MNFYVYVDWTTETVPRPFYVGKGSGNRVLRERRNWKHRSIRNRFGIKRQIVCETPDESSAFEREIEFIAKFHTFVDDLRADQIACNFTAGGDGGSRPSALTRSLIGASNRRRKGEKRSQRCRENISKAVKAFHLRVGKQKRSQCHRQRISQGLLGHTVTSETRNKLSLTTSKCHADPVIKERMLSNLRAKIAIAVLEIDPVTENVIAEHVSMNAAAKSADLTVKYLRLALRNDDQVYLVKRTGRQWKIKPKT